MHDHRIESQSGAVIDFGFDWLRPSDLWAGLWHLSQLVAVAVAPAPSTTHETGCTGCDMGSTDCVGHRFFLACWAGAAAAVHSVGRSNVRCDGDNVVVDGRADNN